MNKYERRWARTERATRAASRNVAKALSRPAVAFAGYTLHDAKHHLGVRRDEDQWDDQIRALIFRGHQEGER